MKIIFALLILMVLIVPKELSAQIPEAEKNQDSKKTLVSVPVSVSDREGHYISGLKKDDFTIFEDGIKQKITFFATYDEPLNVALLLDTSQSTEDSLPEIKNAAEDFIKLLNPEDKCLIATFDYKVNILNSFTSQSKTLKDALDKVQTARQEGSVLYRAVEQIAQETFDNIEGRKVMVLLTDSKDFGSSVTKDKLLSQLEEADVMIYPIFYKTGAGFNKLVIDAAGEIKEEKQSKKTQQKKPAKKKKEYTVFIPSQMGVPTNGDIEFIEKNADLEAIESLRSFSDSTAGRFYLSDMPKLQEVFKKVAGELRQQYRLGYRSKNGDAAIHNIIVKVDRSDAVVRARGKFRAKDF